MAKGDFSVRSYADLQGLDQLKLKARKNDPQALEAVTKQFESLFLNMLLKNMRKANESFNQDGLFNSSQSQFYQQMLDQELSVSLSNGQGVGISEVLLRQLSPKAAMKSEPGPSVSRPDFDRALDRTARSAVEAMLERQRQAVAEQAPGEAPAALPAATRAAQRDAGDGKVSPPRFDTPGDFVRHLYPTAEKVGAELGLDPRVLIAQSALETGWGKHIPQRTDGSSSHNLFGIKADKRWEGDQVQMGTLEFRGGVAQREQASFRAYGSFEESLRDYASFIRENPRYSEALNQATDGARYLQELQRAGYATDPEYARKITGILGSDLLLSALAGTKET